MADYFTWLNRIKEFCRHDVWTVKREDTSYLKFLLCRVLKVVILAWQAFTTKRLMAQASALTYSTLLAIVPIAAVVFAIARGFGVSKNIETWFRNALSSQPQVAETIIGFVNSYLIHAKGGVILGFGLVIMVWTVVMLTNNIEITFNSIWRTKSSRSSIRMLLDYTAFIFLVPIFIVSSSGVSLFVATKSKELGEYLAPLANSLVHLMPYVIMSVGFICLYIFMPNTRVKFKNVVVPGILAGVCMQLLQFVYIHSQIWVSSYNAIYGSFAALPLFMLWLQISWTIALVGALLCYTNQNHEDLAFLKSSISISHKHMLMLSAMIMAIICRQSLEMKKPLSTQEIKEKLCIPNRIAVDLLYKLEKVRLVEKVSENGNSVGGYRPGGDIHQLTVGMMVDRLESSEPWRLDTPLGDVLNDKWKKVIGERAAYLTQLRSTLLYEL